MSECQWEHVLPTFFFHLLWVSGFNSPSGLLPQTEKAPVERTTWPLKENTFLRFSRHTEETEGAGKLICYGLFVILSGAKKKKKKLRAKSNEGEIRRYDAFTFGYLKFRFI